MSEKILVVDDSKIIVAFVKDLLEQDGYDVISASDGEEALDKIFREGPDLVILDVILPKVDGYQIARRLRNCEVKSLRKMPIIMLSSREALVDESLQETGLAEAYLLKPIDEAEVLQKVRELLQQQSHLPR